MFAKKYSVAKIHNLTRYPISAINSIKKGKQVDWFISRESLRVDAMAKYIGKKMCSNCELNPVEDDLHFLCRHCFKNGDNGSAI